MDIVVHTFRPAPGPLDNPLKGWCTYTDSELYLPYSMGFQYVSWRELEPKEGVYQFAKWEHSAWEKDAQVAGRHLVLRVYLDYPGQAPGLPDWLAAKGVRQTPYVNDVGARGLSPDYDSPVLLSALEKLIAALGARYDTHPRVAFLQLGLLGFWGEWHTWPVEKLFASVATQRRVLLAYHAAFRNKKLMARYGDGEPGKHAWLGYHDDYFPDDTGYGKDWYFLERIRRGGRLNNWRAAVIGGEMVPGAANRWVGTEDGYQQTRQMIDSAHFSWVGPYSPAMEKRAQTDDSFRLRCATLVRQMGYEFQLTQLALPRTIRRDKPVSLTIDGKNQGVAPFYYPWPVQLALLRADNTVCTTVQLPRTDIRTWQPGAFSIAEIVRFSAPPGPYRLAMGMIDPWTRRPAIRFANDLAVTAGDWNVLAPLTLIS